MERSNIQDFLGRESRTDLYFGVVAPTGVERESFVARLKRELKRFDYELRVYRLSGCLPDFYPDLVDDSSEGARLSSCMDAGSRLREEFEADALVTAALSEVAADREARDIDKPVVHLFWSLKHPDEVSALRAVYGRGFHLVGLFASREERIRLLLDRDGISKDEEARALIERDESERGRSLGQQTRKTFQYADVFLRWGGSRDDGTHSELSRFLDLVFGSPLITPRASEHWMFLAYANSVRSGELSRQVGAALVSGEGDLLALGANDAPRRGGGLYWPVEGDDDRDCVRGADANALELKSMLDAVAAEVRLAGLLRDDDAESDLLGILRSGPLRGLTEYGRAVHAEMDALLTASRSGVGTRGSKMFVTTYPCHNCARHLIAAGVKEIVFVEPYPKSRALELHEKDIVESDRAEGEGDRRVRIVPHLGVGARRYLDYFSMHLSSGVDLVRKGPDGNALEWKRSTASPRTPLFRRGHVGIERDVASMLNSGRFTANTTDEDQPDDAQ